MRRSRGFALPSAWPSHVRSAVIHAVALAHAALTFTRSQAANSINARIRLREEEDRLRQEIGLLREEMRIKDSRMEQIPAQRRPHYPAVDRLAILELRSARAWSLAQTARRFLVTSATIASWTTRLDEEGADALVQLREPVNKFPDLVAYLVRRFKVLCPTMGKVKIAQILARIGLHLAATTVGRMLRAKPRRPARAERHAPRRSIIAKHPNYAWNVDLTTVPTALGFWIPWLPRALPQRWPFCWWIAVAIDHCSRRIMGTRIFKSEPTSAAMIAFLVSACRKHGQPRHLITDHGSQFTADDFVAWCRRRGILQRFGALGKYGSLAVVERCIRTIKNDCTRRLFLITFRLATFQQEISLYIAWYNAERPHTRLRGRTPDEVFFGKRPANQMPRFEPRARWPRRSACAAPQVLVRGRPGVELELGVKFHRGRKHLPIVTLKRVA